MTPTTDRLLAALDALTKPKFIYHQSAKNGRGVDHAPLLAQLRDAIASSLTAGGGKSLAHERIPIDPHALAVYDRIERAIGAAFVEVAGMPPALYPEDVLRAWYVRFTQTNPRPVAVEAWVAKINGWVTEIDRILDPPSTVELVDDPCIICGKADALDEQDRLVTAVVVEYRRDPDTDDMKIERTMCRACKEVWEGEHGASSFRRYADEQKATATLYEVEIPNDRLHQEQAEKQARWAFLEVGSLWGRVRLKSAPTASDPVWRFVANLHDTPREFIA